MKKSTLLAILSALAFACAGCGGMTASDTAKPAAAAKKTTSTQSPAKGDMAGSIKTLGGETIPLSSLSHAKKGARSVVYYTGKIDSDALIRSYKALKWTPQGKVGFKMSTGESEKTGYLRPVLIGPLVKSLNGTIVECNTAYGGSRAETDMHRQLAKDHGLTDVAALDILDADGSMELPITGGTRLKVDYVGSHFDNYQSYVVLSHFKGHAMAGLGGAIKNISIGFGSSMGKLWIHSGGTSKDKWGGEQDAFLEAMGDAAKGVQDHMKGQIVYVSVMNKLSVDCDCDGNPAAPDMHDIGILSSTDPVALDQACVDIIYASKDNNASLIKRMESRNGLHTLENAEKIGVGSRNYQLVSLD